MPLALHAVDLPEKWGENDGEGLANALSWIADRMNDVAEKIRVIKLEPRPTHE